MSLYRQLWIAIAVLMLVIFSITFIINGVSSSRYLEEQLLIKNNDDVAAVALSLSQQNLDPVSLEIQLSTLLDHGSYTWVEFRQADGKVSFNRTQTFSTSNAPAWLKTLFPIESAPASADVSSGWTQLGTLSLRSDSAFAYDELWSSAKRSLLALIIATALAGGLGSLLLRAILAPLGRVVDQAEALGERRFIKTTEPKTLEFARVTRAMNTLTERIEAMLTKEANRLTERRVSEEFDSLAGIYTRRAFLSRLDAYINAEDSTAEGSIAVIRLTGFTAVNERFGRDITDRFIRALGEALQAQEQQSPTTLCGRLSGGDFALLRPEDNNALQLLSELRESITAIIERFELSEEITVVSACANYAAADAGDALLAELEGSLQDENLHSTQPRESTVHKYGGESAEQQGADFWNSLLRDALSSQRFELQFFPVNDANNQRLQSVGMLRLDQDETRFTAGQIMPWVNRLNLNQQVDRAVIDLALKSARRVEGMLCINLSNGALTDDSFKDWLDAAFAADPDNARRLCIDFTESATYAHATAFKAIQQVLKTYGASIGIKHMGHQLKKMGSLADLGADYLKVDQLFVRGIHSNEGDRTVLKAYAAIAQSLGAECIAEGVQNSQESVTAFACGATAVTGPGVAKD
ncbi:EAL domain-containing protein [Congregibacter variabilis]|uniref:EAL domain-containing protein n=1 Tax=Congregibacter variabilis TaxID=3081200 RepID=A0ABZ0I689_9GAMM|nr:EAL domain-containing protein [Congregibacter sp. IMCC43200]